MLGLDVLWSGVGIAGTWISNVATSAFVGLGQAGNTIVQGLVALGKAAGIGG